MSNEGGVSRRDFLRRASQKAAKDAVEIGTNAVPGGAVIRRILEDSPVKREDGSEVDATPEPSPIKNPLRWLAALRARRNEPDDTTGDGA